MRERLIAGGVAIALGAVLATGAAVQLNQAGGLSLDETVAVENQLEKFGASSAEIQSLIADLHAGEQWDSLSGEPPTSAREAVVDGQRYSVAVWPDGSLFASTMATIPSGGSGMDVGSGISDCEEGLGAGRFPYFNCHVVFSGAIYGGEFMADFHLSNFDVPASIDRVWGASYFAVAGVVAGDGQSPPVRIVLPEAGTAPAMAELTFLYSATQDVAGSSAAIRLHVDAMDAWITSP